MNYLATLVEMPFLFLLFGRAGSKRRRKRKLSFKERRELALKARGETPSVRQSLPPEREVSQGEEEQEKEVEEHEESRLEMAEEKEEEVEKEDVTIVVEDEEEVDEEKVTPPPPSRREETEKEEKPKPHYEEPKTPFYSYRMERAKIGVEAPTPRKKGFTIEEEIKKMEFKSMEDVERRMREYKKEFEIIEKRLRDVDPQEYLKESEKWWKEWEKSF